MATNVVASSLPERRPTATPTARAKNPRENMKSRIEIWTRQELKSGHVQIFIFQLINKYLDTSRFDIYKEKIKIWTRPDFLFLY